MRRGLFIYNPKTCRYEAAPLPWVRWLLTTLAMVLCSAACFMLIAWLEPSFLPSENIHKLRKENQAYRSSIKIMHDSLGAMHRLLGILEQQEAALANKIFGRTAPLKHEKKTASTLPDNTWQTIAELSNKVNKILQDTKQGIPVALSGVSGPVNWPVLWPVATSNPSVVSGFGERIHPYHKGKYFHTGIDIPAAKGHEVRAAGSGRVITIVRSNLESGYGNYLEIAHQPGIISRYACLHDVAVRQGQWVEEGAVIGYTGVSGNAIAPHVHFEILINNKPVNPLLFLIKDLTAETYARLLDESSIVNQALD